MRKIQMLATAAALLAATGAQAELTESEKQERIEQSRAAVKEFGMTLKGELKKAMKAGGPVQAIEVCHSVAPQIAENISEKTGWEVYRTSLKPRNVRPDAWETGVLEQFDARRADGESPKKMEHAEVVEVDGESRLRYMKAIGTKGLCLNCHGTREQIPDNVEAKLEKLYPEDRAIGYQKGDIRGAFSIIQDI